MQSGASALWKDLRVSLDEFVRVRHRHRVRDRRRAAAAGASWLVPARSLARRALHRPDRRAHPDFILWFGIGMGFKIFLVVLVTLFPIAISARTGAR